jgi:TRAP-type C4-dicarboxylate transport system permease large subunit
LSALIPSRDTLFVVVSKTENNKQSAQHISVRGAKEDRIASMKFRLMVEIALMCLAVIVLGTWQGWVKWPEGALMTAALCLVTSIGVLRRLRKQDAP